MIYDYIGEDNLIFIYVMSPNDNDILYSKRINKK